MRVLYHCSGVLDVEAKVGGGVPDDPHVLR